MKGTDDASGSVSRKKYSHILQRMTAVHVWCQRRGEQAQLHRMAAHHESVKAVMIGVGAAFDYHAGTIQRAPLIVQQAGLEWLYRLISEPRRLWRRYLITITLFVFGAARQLTSKAKR